MTEQANDSTRTEGLKTYKIHFRGVNHNGEVTEQVATYHHLHEISKDIIHVSIISWLMSKDNDEIQSWEVQIPKGMEYRITSKSINLLNEDSDKEDEIFSSMFVEEDRRVTRTYLVHRAAKRTSKAA